MDRVKNKHGLMNTRACHKTVHPLETTHGWEHSINRRRRQELAERLLQRMSPSCERDRPKITLKISHVIGRN